VKTLFSSTDKRKTIGLTALAELTGEKATTLYEWLRKGELPAYRNGSGRGRRWKFHRDELEIWWANIHQNSAK
jgi:excisionase family DNA binding protein